MSGRPYLLGARLPVAAQQVLAGIDADAAARLAGLDVAVWNQLWASATDSGRPRPGRQAALAANAPDVDATTVVLDTLMRSESNTCDDAVTTTIYSAPVDDRHSDTLVTLLERCDLGESLRHFTHCEHLPDAVRRHLCRHLPLTDRVRYVVERPGSCEDDTVLITRHRHVVRVARDALWSLAWIAEHRADLTARLVAALGGDARTANKVFAAHIALRSWEHLGVDTVAGLAAQVRSPKAAEVAWVDPHTPAAITAAACGAVDVADPHAGRRGPQGCTPEHCRRIATTAVLDAGGWTVVGRYAGTGLRAEPGPGYDSTVAGAWATAESLAAGRPQRNDTDPCNRGRGRRPVPRWLPELIDSAGDDPARWALAFELLDGSDLDFVAGLVDAL